VIGSLRERLTRRLARDVQPESPDDSARETPQEDAGGGDVADRGRTAQPAATPDVAPPPTSHVPDAARSSTRGAQRDRRVRLPARRSRGRARQRSGRVPHVNAVSRELAGFGEWPDNDDPDGVWARVDDEIKFESGDGWQVVGCR
jgi:hypothetical protein